MERIKAFFYSLAARVANYLDSHDMERILLGCSLTSSSGIVMFSMAHYGANNISFLAQLLLAVVFLMGMTFITNDTAKVESILKRLAIETFAFGFAFVAFYLVIEGFIKITRGNVSGTNILITSVSLFIFIAYTLRLAVWLFSMMKKVSNWIVRKLSGSDVEGITKKIGEVLKNIVSIAGTIGVIYAFLKPIIEKLLGM